jgi:RND family efflux transporter MFP subunit
MVEVGQYVAPGTPMVEVVSQTAGEAWFNVGETEAVGLRTGDTVELRSKSSFPGESFIGTVISISPQADARTRQFPLRVKVNDVRLLPGMAVQARILKGQPSPTLMISRDAALEGKLGLVVYRVLRPAASVEARAESGVPMATVESVPVELGETVDNYVVVLSSGLKPGDELVTRGKEGLYAGAKVIVTSLDSPEPQSAGDGAAKAEGAQRE